MGDHQILPLIICFVFGIFSFMIALSEEGLRPYRRWVIVWLVFWTGPPLLVLWFKAILG